MSDYEKLHRLAERLSGFAPARTAPGKVPTTARLMSVMRKARDANGVAPGADEAVARASSSGGSALPDGVRGRFESSLGADLSGVRVHTGAASAEAASAVGARAFALGNDIHFADGQYAPMDPFGIHLLAHEVAHTQQQAGGTPTRQHKLEVSTPGDSAELEADRAADAMVSGSPFSLVAAPVIAARAEAEGKAGAKGSVKLGTKDLSFNGEWTILHLKKEWPMLTGELSLGVVGQLKIEWWDLPVGSSAGGGAGGNTKDGKTKEDGSEITAKYEAQVKDEAKQNMIDRFMKEHDIKSAELKLDDKKESTDTKTKEKTSGQIKITTHDGQSHAIAVQGVKDGKVDVNMSYEYRAPFGLPDGKIGEHIKYKPTLDGKALLTLTPKWSDIFKRVVKGKGGEGGEGEEKPGEGEAEENGKEADAEEKGKGEKGEGEGEEAADAEGSGEAEASSDATGEGAADATADGAADGALEGATEGAGEAAGAGGREALAEAAAGLDLFMFTAVAASVFAELAIAATAITNDDKARAAADAATVAFAQGGAKAFGVNKGGGSGSYYALGLNTYNGKFFGAIAKLKEKCKDQKPSTEDCAWAIRKWAADNGEKLYGAIYNQADRPIHKKFADAVYQAGHCDDTYFDSDARRDGEAVGSPGWEPPQGANDAECRQMDADAAESRGESTDGDGGGSGNSSGTDESGEGGANGGS